MKKIKLNRGATWLKEFSKRPLLDGKTIVELLKYDEYSLWWFLEWLMEFGRYHFPNIESILDHPQQPTKQNILSERLKFCRIFLRKFSWLPFSLINHKKNKNQIAFITTLNYSVYDAVSNKIVKGDRFLPVINEIQKISKSNILLLDIPFEKEIGFSKFMKWKKRSINIVPLEAYMGMEEYKKARGDFKYYQLVWKTIKVKDSLDFLGPNIKKHIISNFDFFFSYYLPFILWEIEAYKKLFDNYDINIFVVSDPFNPTAFKAVIASNCKSLGIQLGVWGTNDTQFVTSKQDLKSYPLVDCFAVFDENTKRNLIKKKNVPQNTIQVVGNYRGDELYHQLKEKKISLSKEHILFASQPVHDNKEFNMFLDRVFSFLKQYPEEKKIIRPHPGENNLSIYESLIKKYKIKNVEFSLNEDILFPLSKSKLVISAFSTVLSDAVLLGKPAVVIDVFNKGYKDLIADTIQAKTAKDIGTIMKIKTNKTEVKLGVYNHIAKLICNYGNL